MSAQSGQLAVDKKAPMRSPLAALEQKVIRANVDRFPRWLEGYHLTLLTIPWSAGMVVFGWLAARHSLHWLWLSSLMLFLQWFTDSFDGALGRRRDTGIPKWGFYMDHLLDFVYMMAIFVGYAFILATPLAQALMLVLGFLYALLMVSSWLAFAATNEFKITFLGLGPTEVRLLLIVLNTFLIFCGAQFLEAAMPWATAVGAVATFFVIFRTQRHIWGVDMEIKRKGSAQ